MCLSRSFIALCLYRRGDPLLSQTSCREMGGRVAEKLTSGSDGGSKAGSAPRPKEQAVMAGSSHDDGWSRGY